MLMIHSTYTMNTQSQKSQDALVKTLQKKYGFNLSYSSDKKMYDAIKKSGFPSLSKLLKMAETSLIKNS